MELELRVADTLSLYRGKKEKWWENVIELGAKVWQITKFRKKLQIVTNQELRNAFINVKTDLNNTKVAGSFFNKTDIPRFMLLMWGPKRKTAEAKPT